MIFTKKAHPPVNSGLGAVFIPRPRFSTEEYARDLHLEMRSAPQTGVAVASMAWGLFDLRSSGSFIPPTVASNPALGPDPLLAAGG
jgi:hypothetical protein